MFSAVSSEWLVPYAEGSPPGRYFCATKLSVWSNVADQARAAVRDCRHFMARYFENTHRDIVAQITGGSRYSTEYTHTHTHTHARTHGHTHTHTGTSSPRSQVSRGTALNTTVAAVCVTHTHAHTHVYTHTHTHCVQYLVLGISSFYRDRY